ncbi:hypothetical protein NOF04DRAFT_1318998 [Fusarium oxysporum II5]|nr:hypothetical protein NOF04DRAFT_1318998 [Fusarium oxysporum II5]
MDRYSSFSYGALCGFLASCAYVFQRRHCHMLRYELLALLSSTTWTYRVSFNLLFNVLFPCMLLSNVTLLRS